MKRQNHLRGEKLEVSGENLGRNSLYEFLQENLTFNFSHPTSEWLTRGRLIEVLYFGGCLPAGHGR